MLQKLKGYRTVLFGTIVAATPAILDILSMLQMIDLSTVLPPRVAVYSGMVVGVLIIVLRFATTGPVGKDEDA